MFESFIKRLVLVEDADKFVTTYRADLEKWVEKSASSATTNGVLLLVLQSFAANTKLYKMVSQAGLMIEAKAVAEKDIPKWIIGWAKNVHRVKCDADAAELLCQHVGAEHGLLDQELAKLALSVPPKGSITQALVEEAVGTWRSRSTFEMLDLALAGKTEEAIRQLRLLFAAGENEIGILAQMAYSLRKLGAATNLILASENAASNKSRDKISVTKALEQSGVTNNWQKSKLELQLKQLGRHRGQRLSSWLLEADLDLKGASRRDGQLVMETLIVKISASQLKDRGAVPPTT